MYLELQNIEVGKKEFLKLGHTYCKGSCQKKTSWDLYICSFLITQNVILMIFKKNQEQPTVGGQKTYDDEQK